MSKSVGSEERYSLQFIALAVFYTFSSIVNYVGFERCYQAKQMYHLFHMNLNYEHVTLLIQGYPTSLNTVLLGSREGNYQ